MSPTNTTLSTPIATTIPANHPNFDKFMKVLSALEPLVLAGVSPFIKNASTQQIIVNESPVAQALVNALSEL